MQYAISGKATITERRFAFSPSNEAVNRKAAKDLRSAGFNVNAGHVRHVGRLIESSNPEALPKALQRLVAHEDNDALRKVVDISSFR